MSESYIQNLFAERIGGKEYGKSTAIYKFEKIKRAKRAALAANPGAEIIDMGVGEPDEMAFPDVVAELRRVIGTRRVAFAEHLPSPDDQPARAPADAAPGACRRRSAPCQARRRHAECRRFCAG